MDVRHKNHAMHQPAIRSSCVLLSMSPSVDWLKHHPRLVPFFHHNLKEKGAIYISMAKAPWQTP